MICLYFSLSSSLLFLALWENDKCLISIQKENARLHSENFLFYVQRILEQTNHSLKEVNEIYFTSLPSGQTGIRVALAFLATCQVLNPKIKLYHLNSLLLQAGTDNCLSLLSIDRQGKKYHAAVYQNKKCLLASQVIPSEELGKIEKKFPTFLLRQDFQQVNFLSNFEKLKSDFVLLGKIEEINY